MSITLKVRPEVLLRAASDLNRHGSRLRHQMETVDSGTEKACTLWKGETASVFKTSEKKLYEVCAGLLEELDNVQRSLILIAETYQNTETEAAGTAGSLLQKAVEGPDENRI